MTKKQTGILVGKFIKQINPTLFKFQATAQICYIICTYPPELDVMQAIRVKEKGMLASSKLFKHCGKSPYNAYAVAYRTKKLIANREKLQVEQSNPAFTEGKYKSKAWQNRPDKYSHKGQKHMMMEAVGELRKVLRDAPENQKKIITPRENNYGKWRLQKPRSPKGAAEREKIMIQNKKANAREQRDMADFLNN